MNNNTRTQPHRRESDPGQALSRRQVLKGAGALAGSALAAPSLLRGKLRRPNVLLIIADDLAAWMTGCYGNQLIRTPHIDRLAAAGTRFENGFVCTPICSPSRATLMTGRIPPQTGIHDWLTPPTWEDRVYAYLGNTYWVRESRYKYVMRNQGFGPNELWDLEEDPTEHDNRIDDPALQMVAKRLRHNLTAWLGQYGEKWAIMPPQA